MNKKVLIVAVSVLIAIPLIYYFGFRNRSPVDEMESTENAEGVKDTEAPQEGNVQIANPASVYCEEQGGILTNMEFEAGSMSFCVFEDGSECQEWNFFNKICSKGDLKKQILTEGEGKRVYNGDTAVVHYVGTLEDGTKFDSSLDRNETFSFILGAGQVIQGWEQGVLGMQVGEERILTIAPSLGYGEAGAGEIIPPNATLIFVVKLMEIK